MAKQQMRVRLYNSSTNPVPCLLQQIKEAVVAIYRERANMAASLKDTDSIVQVTMPFMHACFCACSMPHRTKDRIVHMHHSENMPVLI
eukprot:1155620-Pelagomonas_calceolata.AAC.10